MVELVTGILIGLGWIMFFPLMRLITTFLHEMGHAFPALLFTDKEVVVYIGSYGDISKSTQISFGRLKLYLRFNVFDWKIGMCRHSRAKTLIQEAIIILGGPIASVLVSGLVLYYLITNDYSNSIVILLVGFMLLALFDLIVNLVPSATSFRMHDGSIMMSDGRQLKLLAKRVKYEDDYFDLEQMVFLGDKEKAIERLEIKVAEDARKEYYDLLIKTYKTKKDFEGVISTYEKLVDRFGLSLQDYREIGMAYGELKNYKEAIRCLNEYLHVHFSDAEASYVRGVSRYNTDAEEEAIRDFEAAIMYGYKKIELPLAYRAFIRMNLGDLDGAEEDLHLATKAAKEPYESLLLLHWAFYYDRIGEYQKAIEYYEKAKEAGSDYHGLEYKMYAAEEMLKGRGL